MHNVMNATAAIAVGVGLDIPAEKIREGLEHFRGVDRRFQVKGVAKGITVVDDYGHHPTEIRATLAAARQYGSKRVHVIFQPHRFTRTRDLMDEFASAFSDADTLQVLDIYPANEPPIPGVTAEALVARMREKGANAAYAASFPDAVSRSLGEAQAGELVITLGAGNVSQVGPLLLQALEPGEESVRKGN
jgi:UDP-N-acetylmuramate--alanine ligase